MESYLAFSVLASVNMNAQGLAIAAKGIQLARVHSCRSPFKPDSTARLQQWSKRHTAYRFLSLGQWVVLHSHWALPIKRCVCERDCVMCLLVVEGSLVSTHNLDSNRFFFLP